MTHVTDLSNYKILVVDDEPDMLEYISTVLQDNGAMVVEARDGEEALRLAREEKPNLMTLDITMPKMDGGQVFEAMRSDPQLKEIPVCIISGQPELRRLIYQRTVPPPEGYLDKPIDDKSLLMNIRKILFLAHRSVQT
jgi:CheY-like chemotaxis protein